MIIARQSTARTVTVGPVLDADGVAVTGGVVADFKIAKNGGAPAALNGSATATHRHTGYYSLALTASDLDTVGQAEVTMDDTVNAMPMKELTVIEEAVYDISFAASATGAVPVASIAANAITATSIAADAITDAKVASDVTIASVTGAVGSVTGAVGSVTGNVGGNVTGSVGSVATGGISAASFAAGAIDAAAIAADAIDASALAADAIAEINATVDTAISDAALATAANLATVAGYLDTEIAAILADTNELQTDWVNGGRLDLILDARASQTSVDDLPTNAELATSQAAADDATLAAIVALNNLSAAQVNAEVDTALADIHLDHLLAATYDPASKPGAADALLNELVESDAGVARYTANALEQGPSGGGGVADWTADERTALRSILGIPASGTTPDDPSTGILDTIRDSVATRASQTSVDDLPTNAELATSQAAADDATLAAIAALSIPSAATTASAVRTELTTELGRIDAAVSTRATPAQVATELATYDGPTHAELTAGLAAADDAVLAQVALVKAKTDNLPTDPADQSAVEAAITAATSPLATAANLATVAGYLDTEVAAIKAVTDALTAVAAAKLAASALGIITGTIDSTVTPTTTAFECDDITEATADHYVGRIITFTSGALLGQSTDITDYALASGKGRFTVTALTEAPGNNDTLVIT